MNEVQDGEHQGATQLSRSNIPASYHQPSSAGSRGNPHSSHPNGDRHLKQVRRCACLFSLMIKKLQLMGSHGDVCVVGEMNPTFTGYIEQFEVAQKESETVLNVVCPCLSCVLSHLVNLNEHLSCSRSYPSFWFLVGQGLEGHHADSDWKIPLNPSQRCSQERC